MRIDSQRIDTILSSLSFSQHAIEQLQEEVDQLRQASIIEQPGIPSDKEWVEIITMFICQPSDLYSFSMKSLHEIIRLQSEQLRDLNEKYVAASSQVKLQAEIDTQK